MLSFGATKGGAMGAEAVIFFDPKRGANMQDRRKRGGATRLEAPFHRGADGGVSGKAISGSTLARHANAMADALAAGLTAAGCKPVWPVEANEVFAPLSRRGSTSG